MNSRGRQQCPLVR